MVTHVFLMPVAHVCPACACIRAAQRRFPAICLVPGTAANQPRELRVPAMVKATLMFAPRGAPRCLSAQEKEVSPSPPAPVCGRTPDLYDGANQATPEHATAYNVHTLCARKQRACPCQISAKTSVTVLVVLTFAFPLNVGGAERSPPSAPCISARH